VNDLTSLAPSALLIALLNTVGLAIQATRIPNRFIPLILLALGGVAYPTFAPEAHWTLRGIFFGIILGGSAVGFHQLQRQLRTPPEAADGAEKTESKSPK
jgi:hypothetical protein